MSRKQRRWDEEFKDILEFWDFEKNLATENKTAFFKKVYWKCKKGHEWSASPYDMTQRNWNGCPICNNKKFVNKYRNFSIAYPYLLEEWDFQKNIGINPEKINPHCGKKVWWKCKKGHEWEANINGRTKGFGCPFCSGNKPSDENNLSLYTVSKEWHPTKNGELRPENISPFTDKKVWWLCPNGHEYETAISNRTSKNSGCPHCHRMFSCLELRIFVEMNSIIPSEWQKDLFGYSCDIFCKDMNLAIEVDGSYWHKNKEKYDEEKTNVWVKNGVTVIRLREKPLKKINGNDISYFYQQSHLSVVKTLVKKIYKITKNSSYFKYLCMDSFIDNDEYYKKLSELSQPSISILDVSPELAKEWHPIKNRYLSPSNFSYGSQKKVWWLCKNGHEWEAIVSSRVKGHNCPYCSRNKTLKNGDNTLGVKRPELICQWDYDKNGNITPFDVSFMSSKKVWWLCDKNHSYLSVISGRSSGRGCPICHEQNRSFIAKKAFAQKVSLQNPDAV